MSFRLRSFCLIASFAVFFPACRKWNPDEQFAKQMRAREEIYAKSQAKQEQQAKENLVKIEREALVHVRVGMPLVELNKLMGYRFEVLASVPTSGSTWETRRYRIGHLVASTWGPASLEYGFCNKDQQLFTVTLANDLVREVEY
tara:strand:+ start:415 stop:846 length:432 start_codon:yes stop_codon:yes gene_type:complete